MAKITYVEPDGSRSVLDVPVGVTVMDAAVEEGIGGIVGQCGGRMVCATCHVFVEEVEGESPPEPDDDEDEMLDYTAVERRPESRLSCQLTVGDGLGALVVRLPESQT
ncbi:2Fe-2S iron-sulfur cluster-binding protein [Kitasatospora sp. CM 4170]|uniref:2Fe-2S iron-sulfur cluster-binding protein n=1 Tax=Kitasatospora aburaviensis TaxID=67265 RepID=A0ABW1EQF0_9ACTN|nr:2Fe-2S iron-sulfur cluster-binding protein [Kitasatospora sp. CM 4170]WNM48411.1 2Fe-2S iron-sulfur cluster-binding protein [Kitasatospora sp. CM 4170]